MFLRLFLLFTIVPALDLALLIYTGTIIGALNTICIVIFTGVVGAIMVRQQGFHVIRRFQYAMQQGLFPAEEILDGMLILLSGALLLTPGFLTDIAGFIFVIPASRNLLKSIIKVFISKYFITSNIYFH